MLELINRAGLRPEAVDEALDDLVRKPASAILRGSHPIVQRLQQASDINVVQISRRSRCLLVEIEQLNQEGPAWQYREKAPRNCIFSCRGQIPDSIGSALSGALLAKLVVPTIALAETSINDVTATADGWLNVEVKPEWHQF